MQRFQIFQIFKQAVGTNYTKRNSLNGAPGKNEKTQDEK
jgi:hypothetical protein